MLQPALLYARVTQAVYDKDCEEQREAAAAAAAVAAGALPPPAVPPRGEPGARDWQARGRYGQL